MKKTIYADNAATTQLDLCAFDAMKDFLLEDYSNPSQLYSFSRQSKKALKTARHIIASCINAEPEEIYFTSGGTEGDNWAIKGVQYIQSTKKKTVISCIEHHAVLHSAKAIERLGYPVSYVAPTKDGLILPERLEKVLCNNTSLVSMMLANNEIGTIQPVKKLAELTHSYGSLFHTDAVQAVGHIAIDVKDLGVDLLTASAHKFNGPKGVGFMYIKKGTQIAPLIDGGSQEQEMRAGTENVALIVAMAVALQNNCTNLEKNACHIKSLESALLEKLSKIDGIDFYRNGGDNTLAGNISLSFKGFDGEALLHRLDLMGISVSTGSACNSKETKLSHVLEAIGLDADYARGTIRISLGKYNTIDDVDAIVRGLERIIARYN